MDHQISTGNLVWYFFILVIGYLVKIIHALFIFFISVAVFFSNSKKVLSCVIMLNIMVVTQWYIFGDCMVTPIENWFDKELNGGQIDRGEESHIYDIIDMVLPFEINHQIPRYFFSVLPAITTGIALYKMNIN